MTHSSEKSVIRRRMRYTGETYQQASAAMKDLSWRRQSGLMTTRRPGSAVSLHLEPGPLSTPSLAQQQLESDIMMAMCWPGGSDCGWVPRTRWWDSRYALPVLAARPRRDYLELVVPDDLLNAFLWCVYTQPVRCSIGPGVPGMDQHSGRGHVTLIRPNTNARVVVRTTPGTNGTGACVEPAKPFHDPQMSRVLNPRWAQDESECRMMTPPIVGSELLRRVSLFSDEAAGRWVSTWRQANKGSPTRRLEWLPDPIPNALARELADPEFGIRIRKRPDPRDRGGWTSVPAFHAGFTYEQLVEAR